MYFVPKTYPYPQYYANGYSPMYPSSATTRYPQQNSEQVVETIFAGIKREASAIVLYNRLANITPNEQHKDNILQVLESKNSQLNQFTNLYISLTGMQPQYQINEVDFRNYQDGLKKAHDAGVESYEAYRKDCSLTHNAVIQNVFLRASCDEMDNILRISDLNKRVIKDKGPNPFVVDIEEVTEENNNYRTTLWTGKHLQVTLMSINVGDDIGLEVHPTTDQFIRIEEGRGLVQMGKSKDKLDFEEKASDGYAIMVPAGTWHNVTNTGRKALKVYVIYAPPHHPHGTVHETKANAMASEEEH